MDNSPQYVSDNTIQPLSTFDIYVPPNFLRFTILTYIIVAIALIVFWTLAPYHGLSRSIPSRIYLSIGMVVAFFFLTIVHESTHLIFQWLFSSKMPKFGFKKGNPYSALAANVCVTRNQFIFISLAPFIIITPLLLVVSLFFSGLSQLVIITVALLEVASCSGDFLTVKWLLSVRRQRLRHNLIMDTLAR